MECVSTPFGRALGSHSRGQGFESPYLHHTKTRNINLMFLVFVSVNPGRYGDSKASGGKPRRQVARAQMITFLTESEPISPPEVAFAL